MTVGAGAVRRHASRPLPSLPVLPAVLAALAGAGLVVLLGVDAATSLGWPDTGPGLVPELPPGALPASLVALVLMVAGQVWPVLPGRLGDIPTSGWSTSVSVATLFVGGPFVAVTCACLAGLAGLAADRRRSEQRARRAAADACGLVVAGVLLVAVGGGGVPERPLAETGLEGVARAALACAVVFGTHLAVLAALDASGRAGTWRAALDVRVRESGVALGALVTLGPVVAVLLQTSGWLAVGAVTALSAIEALSRGVRDGGAAAGLDPLTQLPTREGLLARAEVVLRSGSPAALLVVDLDRFGELNDGHGHVTGDRVLRVVAQRLRAATRPVDLVARVGGDEFGVLVPGVLDVDVLTDLAKRVRSSLSDQIEDGGQVFGPGASIGIALAPVHASSASQLLDRADAAMQAAKDSARGVRVYDERADAASAERLGLMASLRSALEAGGLALAYQPKVALAADGDRDGDRLVGVEALLRWDDPSRGQVEPGYFIPLVEQTGLMGRLTTAVLDLALDQVATWLHDGERIPVAVNVSLRDLEDPEFAARTSESLLRSGVPGTLLTLEITERVLTGDLSAVRSTMERLERIGVRMSLDDFGTGWSSLLLLRRLPVAEVKLDRSFVAGVDGDEADHAVVQAIVDLSRRLDLTMVAEGVERPTTLQRLRALGVDVAQGYLLAEPLAPPEVVRWARHHAPPRLRVVS